MKPSVRIDRVLNYTVFSRKPVHVRASDGTILTVHPIEVDETHLWLKREDFSEISLNFDSNTTLEVELPYKDSLLKFHAEPCTEKSDEKNIALRYEKTGVSINRRRHNRRKLCEELQLNLEGTCSKGNFKFKGKLVGDISIEAIAVRVPRSAGLLLPGDKISRLEIRKNKKRLLVGQGNVRLSAFRNEEQKEEYTVVISNLREPSAADAPTKRSLDRHNFETESGASIHFQHPLFPEIETRGQIIDLSLSGIAFTMEKSRYPLPPGSKLEKSTVILPGKKPVTVNGAICGPLREVSPHTWLYRMRFENVTPTFQKQASSFLQERIDNNLADSESLDDEALWELFFESEFIYGTKRKNLQDNRTKLFQTYRTLMNTQSPVSKKLLYKENGELRGHLSAIRTFDSSWMVQHLSAIKSESKISVAESLLRAIILFFQDTYANSQSNAKYGLFYYRPENLYPSLVFGTARDLIEDDSICNTTDLKYCLPTPKPQPLQTHSSVITEMKDGDPRLSELEHILLEGGNSRLMNLEDLHRESILNLTVSNEFKKLGLERNRRVFMAHDPSTGNHAFSVCNQSSPGLNLSELTNSIRIFSTNGSRELLESLARHSLDSYRSTSNPVPVLLSDGPVPHCFEEIKVYRYWSLDLRHIRKFLDSVDEIFKNLKSYIRATKEKQNRGEAV